jgi:hypothetical protein
MTIMKQLSTYICLILIVLTIVFNLLGSSQQIIQQYQPQRKSLHSLGKPFIPLSSSTTHFATISYLTDKNIEDPQVLARYQLAQFILAPSLILLNQPTSPLALVDAQDPTTMLNYLQTHQYQPAGVLTDSILVAVQKP